MPRRRSIGPPYPDPVLSDSPRRSYKAPRPTPPDPDTEPAKCDNRRRCAARAAGVVTSPGRANFLKTPASSNSIHANQLVPHVLLSRNRAVDSLSQRGPRFGADGAEGNVGDCSSTRLVLPGAKARTAGSGTARFAFPASTEVTASCPSGRNSVTAKSHGADFSTSTWRCRISPMPCRPPMKSGRYASE